MSRSLAVLWFASLALPSAGCMSVVNHAPLWCHDEAKRERVYGGVLLNVESAVDALGSVARGEAGRPREVLNALWIGGVVVAVDMPLCAVADTLLLPRTLAARRSRRAVVPTSAPEGVTPDPVHPKNLFADLVDNKFRTEGWAFSPRFDMPLARDRADVAPMPRRVER